MNKWNRLLVLFTACLFVFGCTKPANHSSSGERGIASVGSKNFKIKRKGLVIDHRSLLKLDRTDRIAYYMIFVNFAKFRNDYTKRHGGKYAMLPTLDSLMFNSLDAMNCMDDGWALDNGQTSCHDNGPTGGTSNFDPDKTSEWDKFGLVDLDYSECTEQGYGPCPMIGLFKDDNSAAAKVMCAKGDKKTGARSTDSCLTQATQKRGTENLVDALDRCERENLDRVYDLSCSGLKRSAERTIAMYENNCKDSNIGKSNSLRSFMVKKCKGMQAAVDEVSKTIDHNLEPQNRNEPPKTEGCQKLANQVEQVTPLENGKNKSSKAWNSVLDFATNVCGADVSGRRGMAAKLGDCSSQALKVDPAAVRALTDKEKFRLNEKRYKSNNNKDAADRYSRNFAETFGLTPRQFKSLFCDTKTAAEFRAKVTDKSDRLFSNSHDSMADLNTYDVLRGQTDLTKQQFNVLKNWNESNYKDKLNCSLGCILQDSPDKLDRLKRKITPQAMKNAEELVDLWKNQKSVKDIEDRLELWFKKRGIEKDDVESRGEFRIAIRSALIKKLQSPKQQKTAAAAKNFYKACAKQTTENGKSHSDGSRDPYKTVSNKCYYDEMDRNIYDFFSQKLDTPNAASNLNFIIGDRNGNCYKRKQNTSYETTRRNDRSYISGVFVNAMDKTDEHEITLNANRFAGSDYEKKDKPWVLYVYHCPTDPVLSDEASAIGADSVF